MRRNWNRAGLIISSFYLLLTVFNRQYVDNKFESALTMREIPTERHRVNPIILQNALWNCIAESDSNYYIGLYSIFDSNDTLHWINVLPKNLSAESQLAPSVEYQTLDWFSDGYLQVVDRDSLYDLFDLRFGAMRDTIKGPSDFVFRFQLIPKGDEYEFRQVRTEPENMGEEFRKLLARIRGY